jgi:hypothetical protein
MKKNLRMMISKLAIWWRKRASFPSLVFPVKLFEEYGKLLLFFFVK